MLVVVFRTSGNYPLPEFFLTYPIDTKTEAGRVFPAAVGTRTAPKLNIIVGYAETISGTGAGPGRIDQVAAHACCSVGTVTGSRISINLLGSIRVIAGCVGSADCKHDHKEDQRRMHLKI